MSKPEETVVLGAGCFWCSEAVFEKLAGVKSVQSGYSGGDLQNPTYDQVCTGSTNHAEVVKVVYDPGQISFEQILDVFFSMHDPTTLNQQGADIGSQYRSVIFYTTQQQKEKISQKIRELEGQKKFDRPIVTQVGKLKHFFEAEEHHQNYYKKNKEAMYCRLVIDPKLSKLQKNYSEVIA